MSTHKEVGRIVGVTKGGSVMEGPEVVVTKPDILTRVVGTALAPAGIGLLGVDAISRTSYVKSEDGTLNEVTKVISRSK
jgi:hypothetical protein